MFENIRNWILQKDAQGEAYRKRAVARQAMKRGPSDRRVIEAGNWTDAQGRNIPDPWRKREWPSNVNIANLPAMIDSGISGPTKTMYGARSIPFINPKLFKRSRPRPFRSQSEIASQRTLHESEVVAMDIRSRGIASSNPRIHQMSRDERLARGIGSDNHTAALDATRKHPRGSTDVLSRIPQPRDGLRGQGIKGPITWAILFELLSKFLGEEGAKARMRRMGFGV